MGSRYYDPSAGRFITRDSIGYNGGINLYSYAGNNPVNRIDPSGHGGDDDDADVFDSSGAPTDPVENWFWRYHNERLITGETAGLTQAEIDEQAWPDTELGVRDPDQWKAVHNLLTPSEKESLRVKLKIPRVIYCSKPHTNATVGHWETILEQVKAMQDSGDYDRIYVNLGVNRDSDTKMSPNRRPDIRGIRWNGNQDLFEIPSKSDKIELLRARMEEVRGKLGPRAGSARIVPIP